MPLQRRVGSCTIFENSSDGIRLMDRYGRIVMVISAYCDLVKTSREELLREYTEGMETSRAVERLFCVPQPIRCGHLENSRYRLLSATEAKMSPWK